MRRVTALTSLRQRELALGERALCDALLAVAALAAWDTGTCGRIARRTISQTIERRGNEPLFEARVRRTARFLACAVCIASVTPCAVCEHCRGRSIRSSESPQNRPSRDAPRNDCRRTSRVCQILERGVPGFRAVRPTQLLTAAELEVMRALPGGMTLATIASSLGKSRKTVERQVGSIYAKLHVANRAQAIQRARDLGINA